ncbi:MAG: Asp-tRNA(Asn)/Glu-tRNA(Gln) amidotransferase subunit GatA [bacterium]
MNYYDLTIAELHDKLVNKEISAVELTKNVLQRMEQVEGDVHAFVTTTPEIALAQAEKVDAKIAAGEEIGALAGIPGAIKDNMCTKGVLTTCSSKILENFKPPYTATAVEKLEAEGLVMVGKTNMDEFAMGSSCETSYYGPTKNPWNLKAVPGGSSGGSAASVAAGEAVYALGSDTGGSIRQPASFCGVVGMKPTYGTVSRYGLVAFASSLDQIGPFTKTVQDTALVLNAITGHDPMDSTSLKREAPDYTKALVNDVKGLKIGIPKEYFGEGTDPAVHEQVMKSIKLMEDLGAHCEEISLPHTEVALSTYYILAPSEASSNLARFDGIRYGFRAEGARDLIDSYKKTRSEGFGPEVQRRIMLGTYALSSGYYDAYYLKAQKVRTLIKREFDAAFADYDVLMTPTSPTAPFNLGEKTSDPLTMYLSDACTIPINIAGLPALSMPCGYTEQGPIGLQIIGQSLNEEKVLRVAYTFEQNTDFHKQRPNL